MKYGLIIIASLFTSSCGDIGSTAASLGDFIPTVNNRCESSECITPAGKAASDAIKAERLQKENVLKKRGGKPTFEMPKSSQDNDDTDTIF
jgi:hypothetical protein